MLSEKEKHGMSELLLRMDREDLRSLAQTVTSRLILPETCNEAIEAIILHTESPMDLLKRRKVKRQFLFHYLHEKRIAGVDPSAEKAALINHVLMSWGGKGEREGSGGHKLCNEVDYLEEDSLPEAPAPSRNASFTCLSTLDPALTLNNQIISKITQELVEPPPSPPPCAPAAIPPAVPPDETAQEMASKFTAWFYDLLNSYKLSEKEHFWGDSSAKISLQDQNHCRNFAVKENGEEVCRTISNIVSEYGIQFNPNNCVDGVQGHIDPHGLVSVKTCGTLHNATACCGIFNQKFGLIRDPFANNSWKIKFTEAVLVSKTVSEIPRLNQLTDFASAMALS